MSFMQNRFGRRATIALLAVSALLLSGCSSFEALTGSNNAVPGFPDIVAATEFESYATQEPEWVSCGNGFECARVLAPENWADADAGEQVSLALIRQPALGSEPPLGTLFINPGGPGASGVDYLQRAIANGWGDELKQRYDMVSWDPRGVGYSDAVSCHTAAETDEQLFQRQAVEAEDTYRALVEAAAETGEYDKISELIPTENEYGLGCFERSGSLFAYVDTRSTARDLDMLRSIVGDDQLNYLGFSYGTKIGTAYAEIFPDSVGRMVLDGAIDPNVTSAEYARAQIVGFEDALRAYVTDCLESEACVFSGTPDEALGEINELLRTLQTEPLLAPDGRTVGAEVAFTGIISGLYSPNSWPRLTQMLSELQQGTTTTTLAMVDSYYKRVNGEYQTNLFDAFQAISCLDASGEPQPTPEELQQNAERLMTLAPTLGEFNLFAELSCAGWPATASETNELEDQSDTLGRGAAPILVVGTTGDPATPYEWSMNLAQRLESGVLVTYHGEGHIAYGRHDCPTRIIDDYLLTGTVPSSDPHCARGSEFMLE